MTVVAAGAVFLIVWASLAVHYSHLDDVLALLFAALAIRAVLADVPALAGLCLGLAVDAKPWALVFLPLGLAVARDRRRHVASAPSPSCCWPGCPSSSPTPRRWARPSTTSSTSRPRRCARSGCRRRGHRRGTGRRNSCSAARWGRRNPAGALGGGAAARHRRATPAGPASQLLLGGIPARRLRSGRPWGCVGPDASLVAGLLRRAVPRPRLTNDAQVLGELRLWLVLAVILSVLLAPGDWCVASKPNEGAVGALRLPETVGRPLGRRGSGQVVRRSLNVTDASPGTGSVTTASLTGKVSLVR